MWDSGHVIDGRYRLADTVGEGGMGEVFRATDEKTGEQVAVKTLRERFSKSPELRERFEREARALFAMEHPHVVAVRDFGIEDGTAYIVTELLEGKTLSEVLDEEETLHPDRALAIARQVLSALAFTHAQGVIHRDMKSENVFLSQMPGGHEHAKLLDFGLVRFVDAKQWGAGVSLTAEGAVLGSPGYISPEQTLGHRGDARSDVYSAGCLLFELLTGEWPFLEDDRTRLFRAHLSQPIPRVAERRQGIEIHPDLQAVISKAMSKPPAERWTDAVAMLSAFDAVPEPRAALEQ